MREHIQWMLSLATRLCGPSDAEDAVQDAFLSALRALPKFDRRSSLKTWLHRITVNACLMRLRRTRRLAEEPIDDYLLPQFDRNHCRLEDPWSQLVTVDEVIDNERRRSLVREKIAGLPDNYRVVLVLRDIEGYSTEQVAELLELSESNVKVRLHRARAALKRLLEPVLRGQVE